MDFFKGLTGGQSQSSEPPASVLAAWEQYSGGDIESQGAAHVPGTEAPSVLAGFQKSIFSLSAGTTSGNDAQSSSQSSISFRIPSGTDLVYFTALIGGALVFYAMAFFIFLPILILAPSKFALTFTFGSICTMAAMIMLSGWQAGLQHMVSAEKLPFSGLFVGSMLCTLYAAIVMHSYLLSIAFSGAQVVSLLYYIMSYFPGGAQGMQFMLKMAGNAIYNCFGRATRGTS